VQAFVLQDRPKRMFQCTRREQMTRKRRQNDPKKKAPRKRTKLVCKYCQNLGRLGENLMRQLAVASRDKRYATRPNEVLPILWREAGANQAAPERNGEMTPKEARSRQAKTRP